MTWIYIFIVTFSATFLSDKWVQFLVFGFGGGFFFFDVRHSTSFVHHRMSSGCYELKFYGAELFKGTIFLIVGKVNKS